jgi:hypothetical protein
MFQLEQKKFFGRRQLFQVDEGEVKISITGSNRNESFSCPLAAIDPSPSRVRRRPIVPWLFAILLTLLGLALILVAIVSVQNNQSPSSELIFAAVVLVIAFQRLAKALSVSMNVLMFRVYGGPNLVLWFDNPGKQQFNQFVEGLAAAVDQARDGAQEKRHSSNGKLSTEVKQLKALHDQGLLDDQQYRAAVNKIVGADPS